MFGCFSLFVVICCSTQKTYDHFCSVYYSSVTLFLALRFWVFVVYIPAFDVPLLLWLSFYTYFWYRRFDRAPLPMTCHAMHTNTHYTCHMPLLVLFKYLRAYFEQFHRRNEFNVHSKCRLLSKFSQIHRSYAPERWLWLCICIRLKQDLRFGFFLCSIIHVL